MQRITKHKTTTTNFWAVLLVGLLLMFAPCSVRNILQKQFSVNTTKTLNQNKTTLQKTTNCHYYCDLSTTIKEVHVKKDFKFIFSGVNTNQLISVSISSAAAFPLLSVTIPHKNHIPLYILYKNFKVFDCTIQHV